MGIFQSSSFRRTSCFSPTAIFSIIVFCGMLSFNFFCIQVVLWCCQTRVVP
jgi:ABC-type transport system involved in Fe-S cluster assembly fused permease/ATPase subunit